MKISAKDEYGLRILLRIAKTGGDEALSISKLSEAEGISEPYAAKIARLLRIHGFIQSNRGKQGGYVLSKPASEIHIHDVLKALDGKLFDAGFCNNHTGSMKFCTNSVDCSVRSLWRVIQGTVDRLLENITIADLLGTEGQARSGLEIKMQEILRESVLERKEPLHQKVSVLEKA